MVDSARKFRESREFRRPTMRVSYLDPRVQQCNARAATPQIQSSPPPERTRTDYGDMISCDILPSF